MREGGQNPPETGTQTVARRWLQQRPKQETKKLQRSIKSSKEEKQSTGV